MDERYARCARGRSLTVSEIDALDRALARAGEDVILRRVVGAQNSVNVDVRCRALVRSPSAQELVAGFKQTDSVVILSPTPIRRAQWPGGQPPGAIHPGMPRGGGASGDKVRIKGRLGNVESVNPIFVAGVLARIELKVLGPAS